MALFTLANWPLLFVCAAMVVAAVIDGWKFKVPNWLTLPLIVSGWGERSHFHAFLLSREHLRAR